MFVMPPNDAALLPRGQVKPPQDPRGSPTRLPISWPRQTQEAHQACS